MLKRTAAIVVTIVLLLSMVCTLSVASAVDAMAMEVVIQGGVEAVNPGDEITLEIYVLDQKVPLSAVSVSGHFDETKWSIREGDISLGFADSRAILIPILHEDEVATENNKNVSITWLASADITPDPMEYKAFTLTFEAKEATGVSGSDFAFWYKENGIFNANGGRIESLDHTLDESVFTANAAIEIATPAIDLQSVEVEQSRYVDFTISAGQYHNNMLKEISFAGTYDASRMDAQFLLPEGATYALDAEAENGSFTVSLASDTVVEDPSFILRLTAKYNATPGEASLSVGFHPAGMVGKDGANVGVGTHYSDAAVGAEINILAAEFFAKIVAGQADKMYYKTLGEACEAALPGETVVLLQAFEDNNMAVMVPAGVTLDLNGKYLTANNFLSFGSIIDTATEVGGIMISNDPTEAFIDLQADNPQLPLYDLAVGCYRFFAYDVEGVCMGSENSVTFGYAIEFTNEDGYEYLANIDSGVEFILNLRWDSTMTGVDYKFKAETVALYAESVLDGNANAKFSMTANNLDHLGDSAVMTVAHSIETATRASYTCAQPLTYNYVKANG